MKTQLIDRIGLRMLVDGDGLADNYKNNTLYFYNKYKNSDDLVTAIGLKDIKKGYFYHIEYKDNSNWMQKSPVFLADYKLLEDRYILLAVNFNFIPLEIRPMIFNDFMTDDNFEKNIALKCSYQGVYNQLVKLDCEYSLVEYDTSLIKYIYRINMSIVPRFLISGDPTNKYDPEKLYNIRAIKCKTKMQRDSEIKSSVLNDFFNVDEELSSSYTILKKHIQRIIANQKKFKKL